jgi:serine/threonine protein kinase
MAHATGSVEDMILRDRWTPEQRLLAFRAMCRAVQRIHGRGIVHRDLKPGNFLVLASGAVQLSDFGTARRLVDGERALLAEYGAPVGDRRYSAPEAIVGLHDLDPHIHFRADIFALGAILFELFAGVPLFQVAINPSTLDDLRLHLQQVGAGHRLRIYHGLLGDLAAAYALPSVVDGGAPVPVVLRASLDRLYQALAAWDYRRRPYASPREPGEGGQADGGRTGPLSPHAWATIFNQVNACLLRLRHETARARLAARTLARRRSTSAAREKGEQG